MSLVDDLEYLRRQFGRNIVLPTPPACQALLALAKAAGIPVGTLFVLSRSLAAGVHGSYDRQSGDMWCHYDNRDGTGERDTLCCLFTLIASVKLCLPTPTTIEEDWDQAARAYQEAAQLAMAWGYDTLFTATDLEEFLATHHHWYRCHVAAAMLAGNLSPTIARDAYQALLGIQWRSGWDNAQFEAALWGVREDDDDANAVVLDFDRGLLRARWLAARTRGSEADPDPLGRFALMQSPRTASLLRLALEKGVRHRTDLSVCQIPMLRADGSFLSCARLESEHDLALLIALVNAWFLDDYPERYARARWTLYADRCWRETAAPAPSPHLYHLTLDYVPVQGHAHTGDAPIQRDLWVLVAASIRQEAVEAAWQRYLRGWLTCTDLRVEALYAGLQAFWSGFQIQSTSF